MRVEEVAPPTHPIIQPALKCQLVSQSRIQEIMYLYYSKILYMLISLQQVIIIDAKHKTIFHCDLYFFILKGTLWGGTQKQTEADRTLQICPQK